MSKKQDLIDLWNKLEKKITFKPGQVVEWKRGLQNKRSRGPFIVVEVLSEPLTDVQCDPGITYFREPLDIVVGELDEDGFFLYHLDSRRLQLAD